MKIIPELHDPLRFLIIELQKQLKLVSKYFQTGEIHHGDNSLKRVDYIDNYHLTILNRCSEMLQCDPQNDNSSVQSYLQLNQALKDLSRKFQTAVFQSQKLKAKSLLKKKKISLAMHELVTGIELIEPAIESESSTLAIDICRLKIRIDKHCQSQWDKYKKHLKTGQQTDSLLEASLIVRDISDMGESLLRIGEGIMSANLGQMIQIDQYQSLETSLSALNLDLQQDNLSIHRMGETKSGCTISGVRSALESEGDILAIFKEGAKTKLKDEKAGIESWHAKYPGVAPKVYSYHKSGDKAALLFEYLTGRTFDKILFEQDRKLLKSALNRLFATLEDIWQSTQVDKAIPANFMAQTKKRINDIYSVHPDFQVKGVQIGDLKTASLETLVDQAIKIEEQLTIPKAVYIHGDFNVDNILYDPLEDSISFIDLHRSDYFDYVQDLSVFMVSNYRLPAQDAGIRKLIAQTMAAVYDFGSSYAKSVNDDSYHLRMSLGLSRSFLTSTRFVLNEAQAKSMHVKARYLLESIIQLKPDFFSNYRVPKELFND